MMLLDAHVTLFLCVSVSLAMFVYHTCNVLGELSSLLNVGIAPFHPLVIQADGGV